MSLPKQKQYLKLAEQALEDNYYDKASAYALVSIALSQTNRTVKELRTKRG
ncbi:hypothetical protein ACKP2L_05125 [Oenococcus alcoholitolerans]|uniref:hypothetical protein n=1 Tax=Oenococcus alcoholitolerans TaxID=931074 RepID=UPI003F6FB57B